MREQRPIFNFYIFHHLITCIIRCITMFIICFCLIIYDKCLSIEFFIHFLLLLSTFDVLLIIIGETAHFWDSTINYKSTLYSKYCLIFGLFLIYFLSSLFLSIHITMGGDNPLIINICKSIKPKKFFFQYNDNETSLIPTKILYLLFILLNLLTLTWIYTSYKDIFKLKRKCLATVFFYSLVLTKFQEHERSNMVNQSLKRLLYVSLFVLSNIISILPGLTIKSLNITLNIYFRIFFIYLTILPWCESVTFLFFNEMKFRFIKKKFITKKNPDLQQRIGTRLSSYRENTIKISINQIN
ncbi:unnamed protein product [Rotaria sordida]|uniref:Uncharacterized protein n=1 Tax=Rotaria sordida TaxID=392033 RepID=A0A818ZR21_9BILA|nr:unnamed protein product [Rotaria sordida]